MTKPRPLRLRQRWLLAVAGLAVGIALAELGFRVMKPLGPEFVLAATTSTINPSYFVDDVELRVVLAPSVESQGFTTNALGLRSPELTAKRDGEKRILALGDSFTLGLAVSDGEDFPARLDAVLGPNITVLNAGVPGYGTAQATGLMRRLVAATEADAVILSVYTGNDLRDNLRWEQSPGMPTTPPPVVAPPPPERGEAIKALARVSRVVAYALMGLDLRRAEDDFRIAEFKDEILPFTGRAHLSSILPPTHRALTQFAAACGALRVRCGIALIPPAYVVHPERLARTFQAFDLSPDEAATDGPQNAIRELASSTLPVIDLTEALRAGAQRSPFLVFDPHFSAEGHAIASEALAPFARRLLEQP